MLMKRSIGPVTFLLAGEAKLNVTAMPRFLLGSSFFCNAFITILTTSKGEREGWGAVLDKSLPAAVDAMQTVTRMNVNFRNIKIFHYVIQNPVMELKSVFKLSIMQLEPENSQKNVFVTQLGRLITLHTKVVTRVWGSIIKTILCFNF